MSFVYIFSRGFNQRISSELIDILCKAFVSMLLWKFSRPITLVRAPMFLVFLLLFVYQVSFLSMRSKVDIKQNTDNVVNQVSFLSMRSIPFARKSHYMYLFAKLSQYCILYLITFFVYIKH